MRTLKHGRPGRPEQLLQASRGEDARSSRLGLVGSVQVPRLQRGWEGRREIRGAGTTALGRGGLCTRLRGSGSATHLSELESRDDGDNDAHEADVEPIPVG